MSINQWTWKMYLNSDCASSARSQSEVAQCAMRTNVNGGSSKALKDSTWNAGQDHKIEIAYSTRIGHHFSSSKEKVKIHRRVRKGVLPHIPLVIHQPGYWKCYVDHRRHVVSAGARRLCSCHSSYSSSNEPLPLSPIRNRKFSTRWKLWWVRFGLGHLEKRLCRMGKRAAEKFGMEGSFPERRALERKVKWGERRENHGERLPRWRRHL
jgi:hypothetical protein